MTAPEYIPYDIEIRSILLSNFQGNVVDIRNMTLEFNVYEDIYDAGMKCDVVVADSLGLIERTPIVGDETIVISFRTPTFKKTRTIAFHIYSIKDRVKQKDRSYTYIIHGYAQELINDVRTTLKGSYTRKISQVVKNIYEKELKPNQNDFSIIVPELGVIETEETRKDQSFIVPSDTQPIGFIRYLQRQAVSTENLASDYMFWQSTSGWHFRTISSLLNRDVVDDFYFTRTAQQPERDNQNLTSGDGIHQYQKIAFVNYANQFNIVDGYDEGLYYNKTEIIDPLTKKYIEHEFNYENEFNQLAHTSNHKYYSRKSPHADVKGNRNTNLLIGEVGDYGSLSAAKGNDVRVTNPYLAPDVLRYRRAAMAQMNNVLIDIGIPGNSDIHVGDLIRVFLQQGSSETEYLGRHNLLFGSNPVFLVTAVRHSFHRENNQYTTILQCAKDTYGVTPDER